MRREFLRRWLWRLWRIKRTSNYCKTNLLPGEFPLHKNPPLLRTGSLPGTPNLCIKIGFRQRHNQALGPRGYHQSKIAGQALPILSHSKTCDLNCGPTKFALVGLWPTIVIRSEGLGVGYLLSD